MREYEYKCILKIVSDRNLEGLKVVMEKDTQRLEINVVSWLNMPFLTRLCNVVV